MSKTKELKAFNEAKRIRVDLISSLEKCKTAGRFKAILEKYRTDMLDGHFSIVNKNLNKPHKKSIIALDAQIDTLIKEKREEFEPKLDALHQQELLKQKAELSSSSEESEHSDVNKSEVVEDSEVIGATEDEPPELITEPPHEGTHISICCGPTNNKDLKKDTTEVSDSSIDETPSVVKQIIPERVRELVRVKAQLDVLSDKKAEFVGKYSAHAERYPNDLQKLEEFNKAIQATENIHANVSFLYNAYVHGDIELDHFKQAAEPLLDDEVEDVQTLKSHRGFKEIADIVANLLILIGTVGTVHAAAALYKGKFEFGLFKSATKSGVIVDNLDNEISHVAAASA